MHKAKVKCIWWTPDDSSIITAGMDGCLYEWKLKENKEVRILKQECMLTNVVQGSDGTLYTSVEDGRLKVCILFEVFRQFLCADLYLLSLFILFRW